LLTPQADLMATDTYNKVFTMHGIIMIFLFWCRRCRPRWATSLSDDDRAKDLALPKVNLLSWYLYMAGGILASTP